MIEWETYRHPSGGGLVIRSSRRRNFRMFPFVASILIKGTKLLENLSLKLNTRTVVSKLDIDFECKAL